MKPGKIMNFAQIVKAAIISIILTTWCSFKNTSATVSVLAFLAIMLTIATMILAITYLGMINYQKSNYQLIANPLYTDSPEYTVTRSIASSKYNKKYDYRLFIILPAISLVLSLLGLFPKYIIGFFKFFRKNITPRETQPLVKCILIACVIQSVISLAMNTPTYAITYKLLDSVNSRVNYLNNYIHNKIYNNASFLNTLTNVPKTNIEALANIKSAIYNIEQPQNLTDPKARSDFTNNLASAFFTLNLYHHLLKIGYDSTNLQNVVNLFNINKLLIGSSFGANIVDLNKIYSEWSPTDFFFRNFSFMDNYTETIKNLYVLNIPSNINIPNDVIAHAMIQVNTWIEEINNRANTIYPEDSWNKFLTMATIVLIVQTIPLFITILVLRDESIKKFLKIDNIQTVNSDCKEYVPVQPPPPPPPPLLPTILPQSPVNLKTEPKKPNGFIKSSVGPLLNITANMFRM